MDTELTTGNNNTTGNNGNTKGDSGKPLFATDKHVLYDQTSFRSIGGATKWRNESRGDTATPKRTTTLADDIQVPEDGGREVISWGRDNRLPERVVKLARNTSIVAGALTFKALANRLGGVAFYKEVERELPGGQSDIVKKDVLDPALKSWFKRIGVAKYMREASRDVEYLRNIFVQVIKSKDGSQINKIERLDPSNCRVAKGETGIYHYKNWDDAANHRNGTFIPFFDENKPNRKTFVIHSKNSPIGSAIYGLADWLGSEEWMEILQEVSSWKLNAIKNGFTIKYHIEYPADYFTVNYPDERIQALTANTANPLTTDAEFAAYRQKKREELFNAIREYLSGAEGAHNSLFTALEFDDFNKLSKGWKIHVLDDKMQYDAWLEDVNTAVGQIVSSLNIHPTLANILIEGKLSSGSDLRNALNIFLLIMTIESRELLLEPLEFIKSLQFPDKEDIELHIKNLMLTTTDENKTGASNKEPAEEAK